LAFIFGGGRAVGPVSAHRAGAARALTLASRWESRHPAAALREEAAAVEADALARTGRSADACAARRGFESRWPKSVHHARVAAACPEVGP
jgi:hypothetical protein